MTGKEVILYILQNNLENEVVLNDGIFIDFACDERVAAKFNVGVATIKVWRKRGILRSDKNKNGGIINSE